MTIRLLVAFATVLQIIAGLMFLTMATAVAVGEHVPSEIVMAVCFVAIASLVIGSALSRYAVN